MKKLSNLNLFDNAIESITTRASGAYYEHKAKQHLKQCGLVIVTQNFNAKGGEIDIIARDNNTLVFVEVRYRKSKSHGSAAASVTPTKQKRLRSAAQQYCKQQGLNSQHTYFRFDIVAFDGNSKDINWIKNAF
ncbi:YraN family protein [Algibacillus agarilyticus]|uniref:YraN family protein n=1 Tax=Algibacillus agarilyticus TaxID=2234133 RepID=UPI000DD0ADF0|nr:YraN family protein [Algibacillus agarilyticus]